MPNWTETDTPVIWASRFPRFLKSVSFGWTCRGNKLAFIRACRDRMQHVRVEQGPASLFLARDNKIPQAMKDAFKIIDGLMVISQETKDIFSQFDMDGVQFFEVPIGTDETGAPSGLANHYVLNVYGSKDALLPELSENIAKPVKDSFGPPEPIPNANWRPNNNLDLIALQSTAGDGVDLWRDPSLDGRLFFSDRLKRAIDAAGLRTMALSFAPTRVFHRTS